MQQHAGGRGGSTSLPALLCPLSNFGSLSLLLHSSSVSHVDIYLVPCLPLWFDRLSTGGADAQRHGQRTVSGTDVELQHRTAASSLKQTLLFTHTYVSRRLSFSLCLVLLRLLLGSELVSFHPCFCILFLAPFFFLLLIFLLFVLFSLSAVWFDIEQNPGSNW